MSCNSTQKRFLAYTGRDFHLCDLETGFHVKTLSRDEEPVIDYLMQSAFIDDKQVVVGTDRGDAIIYDVTSGSVVQRLRCADGQLVQTVSVSHNDS